MKLKDLRLRTRRYVRDTNSKRFADDELNDYINEAIDRIRSYPAFMDMPKLDENDEVFFLPGRYQYMLALYASSRCFGVDNDFYQEQQKRNEFENIFEDLVTSIECGEIKIEDMTGSDVQYEHPIDYVKDTYFGRDTGETSEIL